MDRSQKEKKMSGSSDIDSVNEARYKKAQSLHNDGKHDEAIAILEELAKQEIVVAQAALGNMLLFCPEPDAEKARFWLEKAADSEAPGAFYGLGLIFLNGMGVEKSPYDAFHKFFSGAKLGDVHSSALLGEMLAAGEIGEPRHDLAIPAYWQAAEGGSALAQRRLAIYYSEGIEVERDLRLAHDLYKRSAEQGDAYAANNLAIMYERGIGVEINIDEAIKFYTIAAEKGIPTAQQNLGACLAHPDATNRNLEQAAYWFHKGAETGLRLSMFSLAQIYEHGEGVGKDSVAAEYWRQRAAQTIDPLIEAERNPLN